MRTLFVIIIVASLIGLNFINQPLEGPKPSKGSKPLEDSFAILELFTSEGCSSCPPADNLLPELAKDSTIIPLSFHVDYWNRLGWTDPFSKATFTQRQQEYSRQFNLESTYTPQLVVNGQYELVGSNRHEAEIAIKKALSEKALVQLNVTDLKKEENTLSFIVEATGDLKKIELLAALVQKHATMNIKAGENNGAQLSHTNVVRSFIQQNATAKTTIELPLPKDLADNNRELIIYARQKTDLKIVGAKTYKF